MHLISQICGAYCRKTCAIARIYAAAVYHIQQKYISHNEYQTGQQFLFHLSTSSLLIYECIVDCSDSLFKIFVFHTDYNVHFT